MTGLTHRKHEIRRAVLRRLGCMSDEDRRHESGLIRGQLQRILGEPDGRRLLGYVPLRSEPDLRDFFAAWLGRGGVLCLPKATGTGYEPAAVPDLSEGLVPGLFGIPEPPADAERVAWTQLDFIVVPGLAFDHNGNRLGRGKGFYDRMLRQAGCPRLGVAFGAQLVETVPVEPHDVRLDGVVWADGLMPAAEADF